MFKRYGKEMIWMLVCVALSSCGGGGDKKEERKEERKQERVSWVDQGNEEIAEGEMEKKAPKGTGPIKYAFALVQAKEGSEVVGAVTFSEEEEGVKIVADIGGLSPGKHGFHIHEKGDCSASDASTAGGHFNPFNKKHGGPDSDERHLGDLGNLEADQGGFAHYERIDKLIKLNGEHSIIGKSVIVHKDPDDLKTDPTGNSGKRIGCGEIVEADL